MTIQSRIDGFKIHDVEPAPDGIDIHGVCLKWQKRWGDRVDTYSWFDEWEEAL